VEVDIDAAATWYTKALEADSEEVRPLVDEIVLEWTDRRPDAFTAVSNAIAEMFRTYAGKDDGNAQYCHGACLLVGGGGFESDFDKSGKFFEKAGNQGHVLAQFYAGRFREHEADADGYEKAAEWYGKAAAQGLVDAYFPAGMNYWRTKDLDDEDRPDWPSNIPMWMEKALEMGTNFAAYYLGECFEHGFGTAVDHQKACEMYLLFCTADRVETPEDYAGEVEAALTSAQFSLGEAYAVWDEIESDPETAISWYLKSAERGHAGAEYRIGLAYWNGFYYDEDQETAMEWLVKSADHGCVDAMEKAGRCYDEGIGDERYPVAARNWWTKAAAKGRGGLDRYMARRTDEVIEMINEDFDKDAFAALEQAANVEVREAQYYVGLMYSPFSNQRYVEHDRKRGFELLKAAAERDHYEAAFYVGECYFKGEASGMFGFAKASEDDAEKWYRKATRSSDEEIREQAGGRLEEIEEIRRKREEQKREEAERKRQERNARAEDRHQRRMERIEEKNARSQ
jgi:TPR repeat protein